MSVCPFCSWSSRGRVFHWKVQKRPKPGAVLCVCHPRLMMINRDFDTRVSTFFLQLIVLHAHVVSFSHLNQAHSIQSCERLKFERNNHRDAHLHTKGYGKDRFQEVCETLTMPWIPFEGIAQLVSHCTAK